MPGTVVRVRGIKRYYEPKAGRWYCYHRATGKRIGEEFGSAEFFVRLAALEAEIKSKAELAGKPGTLMALILDYKLTDNFKDLAPRTRSDYEKVFTFLKPLWGAPIASFTTPQIVKLRGKWRQTRGRRFVNYTRAVLSILLAHALELGIITTNPVRGVKQVRRPRDADQVNRSWTLSERRAAIGNLAPHLRLPFVIGLLSGMREGDILRLPPTVIQGGRIKVRTRKRGVWIDIPIMPELKDALAEAKRTTAGQDHEAITLCTNSRGKPWTLSGFSCSFRKALKALREKGLIGEGLTFHGLRHTVATVLAEAGISAEDIAAVLGQRTSQMADHYSREADRSRRTTAAIKKFNPLGTTKGRTTKNGR